MIIDHTTSLKGRESHYSLKDSGKISFPEELNTTKILNMFKEHNPWVKDSYLVNETYWQIFNKNFNIEFGYPRTDTCSAYDEFKVQNKNLELELKLPIPDAENSKLKLI